MKFFMKTPLLTLIVSLFVSSATAANSEQGKETVNLPTQVFFGDTHLHTDLSMDAGAFGNRLGLEPAYRFTRGEEIKTSTGQLAKMDRPLDFVVMADHTDGYGFFPMLLSQDPIIMAKPEGRRWYKWSTSGEGPKAAIEMIEMFSQGKFPYVVNSPEMLKPVWEEVIEKAEKYNEPGKFTAFIGYEWTSLVRGNNLHRVVIYRDNADKAIQTLPLTMTDSPDPEDLWKTLAVYEQKTGGQIMAIAHNGNLSNGLMFDEVTLSNKPLDKAYAQTRDRWEPLYEATQIKGDGEAHPFLSPDDEFADYETWDIGNLDLSQEKTNSMLDNEYARSGLKLGLKFQQTLGVNPFKFGLIGGTDSHTSLPAVEENNFYGKHPGSEPKADRWSHPFMKADFGEILGWQQVSSGYAAVWATENTREALWDAMKRKETYATTGTRMVVRVFGGWDFKPGDDRKADYVTTGYEKGVPMGGDLYRAEQDKSPSFIVTAMRDVAGANLDRIQMVKGWRDSSGELHEKVYDIAWSDSKNRRPNPAGKIPAVGNTVNVADASWANTIGDKQLSTVWEDPSFSLVDPAFYYVRVLEIPTPRWTAYDSKRFDITMTEDVPMTTQERAYTSPIWYTPK